MSKAIIQLMLNVIGLIWEYPKDCTIIYSIFECQSIIAIADIYKEMMYEQS